MHGQREALQHKANIRFGGQQFFDGGIRLLTVRALQIAEFDNRHPSVGWAARRPFGFLLKFQPRFFEGVFAKWNDIAENGVLAIGAYKEFLSPLALPAADLHVDLSQTCRLAGLDADDFPRCLIFPSDLRLQKSVDLFFCR